ncbi:ABC-2 type transport system ATP-binding protein [Clostridium collagenovorans DSM 3089]|uniref:ABC-2 type transport system ATP-binding protein n=1 Tax=Clostridium collagenovorans DSM 3089 TaxID=1121306 RepID=A0A1M5VGI9_9CLOT|nr:ABC transporter ATP-binding protein [Clostridium collagenovorans]SHH74369.1 ABC-2 type transport system ATP-binding protein [Clostridium collagenovorans DSM 3089]
MENVIEVKDLCKNYKDFKLDNVSFSVPKGSIMGLIGANGAGKSTTIKLLLNLLKRNSGSVKIFGEDIIEKEQRIKEEIGVVFDESNFHDTLKTKNIDSIMKSIYKNWDEKLFYSYLKKFKLPIDKTIKDFSRGMKMKLSIAVALSHNPKLLILDEATSGLDPIVRNEILDVFLEFIEDGEHSILLSSHITSDLEKIADYITLINDGKVVFSQCKDDLIYNYGILKGSKKHLESLDKADFVSIEKNSFGFQALCCDKKRIALKYPELMLDTANIEDIMMFFVRGE